MNGLPPRYPTFPPKVQGQNGSGPENILEVL